jgi:hypothetical protein
MSAVPSSRMDIDIHSLLMDEQSQGVKAAAAKSFILPTPVSMGWAQTREGQQRC